MCNCVCWNTCVGGEKEKNGMDPDFKCVNKIEGSCCDEKNENCIRE